MTLSADSRREFIMKAQVWQPTEIGNMNLREGPKSGAFMPNELVTCDHVERSKEGRTRKFHCTVPDGDVVKVRYGAHNGEVQGSVLATRLLWALGFVADRVYPVRVKCRGCSSDPWTDPGTRGDEMHEFDPAVIERKPIGHQMWQDGKKSGWAWPELDLVDAQYGGAPREQLDALTLLAVFMQHSDTKPQQQRLFCLSDPPAANGACERPFLLLHDVGITFGRANTFNRNSTGSVNVAEWKRTPIWKDPVGCVGDLSKSNTGTLGDPLISEAGRRFLADLLVQLSDQQLHDLFTVAGVERRGASGASLSIGRVDEWVSVFKHKRDEIVAHRCAR